MGERQKGRNDLRLASLRRDKEWVALAREVATEIVDQDPELTEHPELSDELSLMLGDRRSRVPNEKLEFVGLLKIFGGPGRAAR